MKLERMTIKDIGEIIIRINPRARRVSIRIKPIDGIILTVPKGLPMGKALKFVEQKKTWILKHQRRFKELEEKSSLLNAASVYSLCQYELVNMQHRSENYRIKITNRTIYVFYPEDQEIECKEFQDAIRRGVVEALRIEAKKVLPGRVDELARIHNLKYGKVNVKNAQTRWGSCSTKKNITLNLHLMRLPEHLRDYVILHELIHTVHPNHGKKFWRTLDEITGNAHLLEKELKGYQIQLF